MPKLKNVKIEKYSFNIPLDLKSDIEKLAEKNGLNMTAQVITLLRYGVMSEYLIDSLPDIMDFYRMLVEEENKPKKQRKLQKAIVTTIENKK